MLADSMVPSKTLVYDVVVLGSSPVCLIEAIHRARGGDTVVVLDRATAVGGAWRTVETFGIQDVEISTHIMRPFRRGYRYIESTLQIPMLVMRPQPFWVLDKFGLLPRRTKYAHTWNIVFYRTIAKLFTREGIKQIIRNPKTNLLGPIATGFIWIWRHLRIGAPLVKYPIGGAPSFIRKLHGLASQAGVEIHTGTAVRSLFVDVVGRRVVLNTDSGAIVAAHLYMTPQAHIEQIESTNKQLLLSPQKADSTHLHMIINDPAERSFSFARFQSCSIYFMVSDISDYAKDFYQAHPGCKLIAAWCRDGFTGSRDAIDRALESLKEHGLVGPGARIIDYRASTYASKTLTAEECRSIKDMFGDFIEVLETDNLTLNISDYFERWSAPGGSRAGGAVS
jgi:hypothetical protein